MADIIIRHGTEMLIAKLMEVEGQKLTAEQKAAVAELERRGIGK